MTRWGNTRWPLILGVAGCHLVFELEPAPLAPAPVWTQLATGDLHSCGIRSDSTLWCWGGNASGEVGVNSGDLQIDGPTQVAPDDTWLTVSAAYRHTCAIRSDHSLWCWGDNSQSQLGTGNATSSSQPLRISDGWTAVSAGWFHTCAIRDDDSLACWGGNAAGQVGDGGTTARPIPTTIDGTAWIAVDTGLYHTCGIKTGGSLWCWGDNTHGEFGDGTMTASLEPREVPGETWNQIALGVRLTCGLTSAGRVRCTGDGSRGTLGNGTTDSSGSFVPVTIDGVEPEWDAIGLSTLHACGITRDGSAWCWGDDMTWQLGIEIPGGISDHPIALTGGAAIWSSIVPGLSHTCAIDGDGRAWCVGADTFGQLGDGGSSHLVPTRVGSEVLALSVSALNTCVIDVAGKPACAGSNLTAQIGDGTFDTKVRLTTPDTAVTGWTAIVAGSDHTCATAGGTRYCWGANHYGQYGSGGTAASDRPLAIGAPWSRAAAAEHGCGISGGAISCWGFNLYGQVGNTTQTNEPTPFMLAITNVSDFGVGTEHTCALDGNGDAWCWGRGNEGQLGNGPGGVSTSPVRVTQGDSGTFESIAAGGNHSCARTIDHRLWCWGENGTGQLGVGDMLPRFEPTRLSTAQWNTIGLGVDHSCGIQTDGTLWCWGYNARGQLGTGTRSAQFVPAKVGEDTDWLEVLAGDRHTCARKLDNSLWCWGSNDFGQLGDGTAWNATPQLVP